MVRLTWEFLRRSEGVGVDCRGPVGHETVKSSGGRGLSDEPDEVVRCLQPVRGRGLGPDRDRMGPHKTNRVTPVCR